MNFLNTTVEPCTSVVKKTRVVLLPNSGMRASKGHECRISISNRSAIITGSGPDSPTGTTSMGRPYYKCPDSRKVLVGWNFLEAPFERCTAPLICGDCNIVKQNRQQHIEAE